MVQHRTVRDPNAPGFPHATNTGFRRGCPCEDCRVAHLRAEKAYRVRRDRGIKLLVPASRTATHLRRLLEHPDASIALISRLCGVSRTTLMRVLEGANDTIHRDRETRVLAVTLEQVLAETPFRSDQVQVTVQRIRSMQAQGWSLAWQARQLGRGCPVLFDLVDGQAARVTAKTADKVAKLAAEVDGKWGPSTLSRRQAAAAGWHPLADYDDHGNLLVDEIDPEQERAEQGMEVLRLALDKLSVGAIAEQSGVAFETVRRYKEKAGLMLDSHGGYCEFKQPEQVKVVRDVLFGYEWEGWTAKEALAKLDIPVHRAPRRGPQPGAGRGLPRSRKAA